eukprot:CAMPEP_0170554252 /NCGR_PEP_ID=MMETSP0211-20121228/12126_1 /TAXON_ID=311385 /ORGANISM="Pseudokeronopsis sp., Strain OXSARD2" /LENGTH=110 /DNA_ID=CAMNT_0010863191 /DNA_START=316 /DNA_END=648 /DNA_ORIENTATION=+
MEELKETYFSLQSVLFQICLYSFLFFGYMAADKLISAIILMRDSHHSVQKDQRERLLKKNEVFSDNENNLYHTDNEDFVKLNQNSRPKSQQKSYQPKIYSFKEGTCDTLR